MRGPTDREADGLLVAERGRIAAYYAQRQRAGLDRRYQVSQPGNLFRVQHLERDILATLRRHGFTDLGSYRILDVGCGDGAFLRRLVSWGADPQKLAGVDLLPERVAAAQRTDAVIDVQHADASHLPHEDGAFDMVVQQMMLSSILDERMRRRVAQEMARVLRPGGVVVSYDFRVARDRRHTRAIQAADLRALFPGFMTDVRRVTLVPPVSRWLAPRSWLACELLEAVPLFRTHELVVLRKPPAT
ncbi:MAG: class I SAM-dependent methyltransferase [Chloroflexi bacterium]|nr:class I SAM-dependent methyltransferase [Chloroflexota bacterium]